MRQSKFFEIIQKYQKIIMNFHDFVLLDVKIFSYVYETTRCLYIIRQMFKIKIN